MANAADALSLLPCRDRGREWFEREELGLNDGSPLSKLLLPPSSSVLLGLSPEPSQKLPLRRYSTADIGGVGGGKLDDMPLGSGGTGGGNPSGVNVTLCLLALEGRDLGYSALRRAEFGDSRVWLSHAFTSSFAISRTKMAGSDSAKRLIASRSPWAWIRGAPPPLSSVASQILRMIRSRLRRTTGFLVCSFWPTRLKSSGWASSAATGGDRRSNFCSGSSRFSNASTEESWVVKQEMIALGKDPEMRACSTRAVSSCNQMKMASRAVTCQYLSESREM